MNNFNPIRRNPIKHRAKEHRENAPWRTPRVRLDGREMQQLRHEVFAAANGLCQKCFKFVGWYEGHAHHVIKRSHGGSDELSNLTWLCPDCHAKEHGK